MFFVVGVVGCQVYVLGFELINVKPCATCIDEMCVCYILTGINIFNGRMVNALALYTENRRFKTRQHRVFFRIVFFFKFTVKIDCFLSSDKQTDQQTLVAFDYN